MTKLEKIYIMKVFLTTLLFLLSISVFGQNLIKKEIKLGSCDYMGGTLTLYYNIEETPKDKYLLEVEGQGVSIELSESGVKKFADEVSLMTKKFIDWDKLAKENDVKDFTKEFNTDISDKKVWFIVDNCWYYEEGVDMTPKFLVDEDGNTYAYIESDEMNQDGYEYVATTLSIFGTSTTLRNVVKHSEGFILMFNSTRQISELYKLLYRGIMQKEGYFKEQKQKNKIFKEKSDMFK